MLTLQAVIDYYNTTKASAIWKRLMFPDGKGSEVEMQAVCHLQAVFSCLWSNTGWFSPDLMVANQRTLSPDGKIRMAGGLPNNGIRDTPIHDNPMIKKPSSQARFRPRQSREALQHRLPSLVRRGGLRRSLIC